MIIIRFYTVTYQLLSSRLSTIQAYITWKSRAVSNLILATKGKQKKLDSIIRSRDLSFYWGDPRIFSTNTIADVFEAIFGAIAFHHNDIDLVLASSKLLDPDPDITNLMIEFYRNGAIPISITEYLPNESISLNDPIIHNRIAILESVQKYNCIGYSSLGMHIRTNRFSVRYSRLYQLRNLPS